MAQEKSRQQKARELYEQLEEKMVNLYSRWLDERNYEDIRDYSVHFENDVQAIGGTFVRMTSRPFGFVYTLEGVSYQIAIAKDTYTYKRIS